MKAAGIVARDPSLRVAALALGLQGAVVCVWGPYAPDLAVRVFGFSDAAFAAMMAAASLASVTAAVWVGIRADQTARRRGLALAAVAVLVAGLLAMVLAPGPLTFALVFALAIPFAGSLFGQVFALARLAAARWPEEDRDGILAVIRALFAAPFVVVLPLWAAAFAAGAPVAAIFPVGLLLALAMAAVVWRGWPEDGAAGLDDHPSGLSLRGALTELARGRVLGRVAALGALNAASTVYMAVIALVLVPAVGRGPADVALYVGLVAGLEVPFMLMVPRVLRGVPRTVSILCGAALYALHLALIPVLAGSPWLWALVLPAAVGGAVTLTVPIAYLQDLLADRPGAGASLMAVQRMAGDVMAAACFALGTALAGYGLVAGLGVAVSLAGAGALWAADRRADRAAPKG